MPGTGGATCVKLVADVAVELEGDGGHRLPVHREGRPVVLLGPLPQRLVQGWGPAHERVLHLVRERLRERGHQIDLGVTGQGSDEGRDDTAAGRLEGGHPLGGVVPVHDRAVGGVLGRVHAVGYRDVVGDGVGERLVVGQYPDRVLVPQHRPVPVRAVRDGTAPAHLVVGGDLVGEDLLGPGVPVHLVRLIHGAFLPRVADVPVRPCPQPVTGIRLDGRIGHRQWHGSTTAEACSSRGIAPLSRSV